MSLEKQPCLFCQTPNEPSEKTCQNCGMLIAKDHPEGKARQRFFIKYFIAILVFCLVMVFFLPR